MSESLNVEADSRNNKRKIILGRLAKLCKIHKFHIHSHLMISFLFTNIFIYVQQLRCHSTCARIHIQGNISQLRIYSFTFASASAPRSRMCICCKNSLDHFFFFVDRWETMWKRCHLWLVIPLVYKQFLVIVVNFSFFSSLVTFSQVAFSWIYFL